jgi:hypothetical protein
MKRSFTSPAKRDCKIKKASFYDLVAFLPKILAREETREQIEPSILSKKLNI